VNTAIGLILEEINQVKGVLKEGKKPSIAIGTLTASTLNIDVYYWLDTFDKSVSGMNVRIEAITKVLTRLEKEGFYLPGDIVELKNYQDRILSRGGEENAA
jgi:small conductance mechanosensitive channel